MAVAFAEVWSAIHERVQVQGQVERGGDEIAILSLVTYQFNSE